MAELLRDADSTERHLAVVYRHVRLCKRVKGADFLVTNIAPAQAALTAAQTATHQAQLDKEAASDDLIFHAQQGADLVRSIFARAQDYERKHPGSRVLLQLFPEEAFGDYIGASGTVSVAGLQIFVPRVAALGQGHDLAPMSAELAAQISAIDAAEQALKQATTAYHLKAAEEEVCQAELRKAYEANYLDARKTFGKATTERLFPRFRRRAKPEDADTDAGDTAPENPAP